MKFSTNLQKIADGIDVAPLLAQLEANPHLWGLDTRRQRALGSPHHDTESLILRGPSDPTLATFFTDVGAEPTDLMDLFAAELHPVLDPILNRIGATAVGRMLIAKLQSGGRIDWHADEGLYAKAWARLHIVLASDKGNRFMVEDESVHMEPGTCWWFAHRRAHAVVNHSNTPRIHLIVDFKSDRFPVERQDQP